jgi:hypothetical protein
MLHLLNLPSTIRALGIAAWLGCSAFCLPAASVPVPVIYSTDLLHPHEDPDDHFDLACLFAMPEADVRAIILDQGGMQATRAGFRAVWQLNWLTGRHVPAEIGLRDKLRTPEDSGLEQPAEYQKGVALLLQTLQASPDGVAIIFVGSARDVTAAYNRCPELFRSKVRAIYGFIGDAGDSEHQEYNVRLDPPAFIRLMREDLPFHWIPCFDGGSGTNNGHASFWQIKHREVLEKAAPPLQRYFLYMLRKETNAPIAYLTQPLAPEDRDWLMAGSRNLWCAALLGLAVGRPLRDGAGDVVGFSAVDVSVSERGVVSYGKRAGSRRVMRFEIKDRGRFAPAATRATAQLLESFPVRMQQ